MTTRQREKITKAFYSRRRRRFRWKRGTVNEALRPFAKPHPVHGGWLVPRYIARALDREFNRRGY